MTEAEVIDVLERVGAFRAGHFIFTSGRHGDKYINKDALYPFTEETSALCRAMAERFKNDGIEVVIGPAVGAAVLSQWVAHHLSEMTGKNVAAVYADKDGEGGFIIKRGYDRVIDSHKVLVVEDLMTTGGSVKKVIGAIRKVDANIVGVTTICNRGGVKAKDIGDPPRFEALLNVHLDSWDENKCPLCERGIPVNVEVGHGREFLKKKGKKA